LAARGMRPFRPEAAMLYLALSSFVLATIMICLDIAGVRFALGAGVTANVLLLVSMASLAAKSISVYRHHETGGRLHP
jgi:hypothetical protein